MSEIRVENIIGETGTDAVKFTKGINVTGVTTATAFSGSGASLTSLPAANLTGTLPAISGANLTGVSGGLVAFKHAPISAYQVVTSTSETATNLQITYTPQDGANNRIYVMLNGSMEIDGNDNNQHQMKLKCTGQHTTDVPTAHQRCAEDQSGGPRTYTLNKFLRDPNINNNTAITYRLWVYCEDVTNSQHRLRTDLSITVVEIDPSANQN